MEIIEVLKNEYLSIVFGGLGGVTMAFLTQKILNKRGVFRYYVNHNKIGVSAQDSVFGNVKVEWNDTPVENLYLSTLELRNESLNDYENVVIKTYTNDTFILSESTQIKDTPEILYWTKDYQKKLDIEPGQNASDYQKNIYRSQREYLIPVFNRGQEISITYLNSSKTISIPSIWLSTSIKGVKTKFKVPHKNIFGVSQQRAAIIGIILGFILLIPIVTFVSKTWIIALISLIYGYFVQIPGVLILKIYRWVRELLGG